MEKKNKKMTLEKLAEITQGGFEELRDEFKNELRSEIGGLRGEFKNELRSEIGGLRGEFKNELRSEIGGLRFELKDEIGKLKDELKNEMSEKFDSVLSGQDHILGRLDNLESDNTMDMAVHRRQGDKLENHEERIVVVEEKVLV